MNVTVESLRAKHGDKAEAVFREICDKGGYGNIPPNYSGGLDIFSTIEPGNIAISEADKDRIAELSGIKRKDADKLFDSGTVITTSNVQDNRVGGK
jgi:hypothetical protein